MAEAPLAGCRRVAFEIRAGQIIEQDVEFSLKQRLPALLQEAEQVRLVRQQFVQAAIQIVLADQSEILAQQIADRALVKPLPVQPPFTARVDQAIAPAPSARSASASPAGKQAVAPTRNHPAAIGPTAGMSANRRPTAVGGVAAGR